MIGNISVRATYLIHLSTFMKLILFCCSQIFFLVFNVFFFFQDLVLNNSEVKLHHNLVDTNIALCSPTVPPLFSDNFDFQTRDDFIHGILINEEILASSLYYTLLKSNQYAAAITNWKTYQTVWYVSENNN